MIDVSKLKEGMKIEYNKVSFAFGGKYTLYSAESTYLNEEDCPDGLRGKLLIIELMNDGTPMFFLVENLDLNDWDLCED